MLLRFIDTEPKDRYDLLDPFLKLGSYRLVEQGFKSSIDDLETERGTAEAEINAEDHKLRRIFAVEADAELTEQGLLDQLNVNLAALDLQSCSNIAGVKACQPQIAAGLGGEAMTERFAALGALKTQVQRLGLPDDLKPLVENLRAALVALENERAERTTEILTDLLVRGKEIIEAAGLETCPLCEQAIDTGAVVKRLDARIKVDHRITEAKTLVENRTKALLTPAKTLAAANTTLIEDWNAAVTTPLPSAYQEAETSSPT